MKTLLLISLIPLVLCSCSQPSVGSADLETDELTFEGLVTNTTNGQLLIDVYLAYDAFPVELSEGDEIIVRLGSQYASTETVGETYSFGAGHYYFMLNYDTGTLSVQLERQEYSDGRATVEIFQRASLTTTHIPSVNESNFVVNATYIGNLDPANNPIVNITLDCLDNRFFTAASYPLVTDIQIDFDTAFLTYNSTERRDQISWSRFRDGTCSDLAIEATTVVDGNVDGVFQAYDNNFLKHENTASLSFIYSAGEDIRDGLSGAF